MDRHNLHIRQKNGKQRGRSSHTQLKARARTTSTSDCSQTNHIHLNWSNFNPEFSGKPEEDAEAHLLCLNDWMEAHHFDEDIKVQRFCLTLLGEEKQDYGTSL